MKPPPLRYERADSLPGALEFLAAHGDAAKVLAGGQSLVPLLNLRLARPEYLLDITLLNELASLGRDSDCLQIGALTTHAEVEASTTSDDSCPLLAEGIRWLAHPAIRNRGTVGGSIAHADPSAELPVVLCALGGAVTLRSQDGERTVCADDFFQGFLQTAAEPQELVTSVSFPVAAPDTGYAFEEFARRPGDFALVAVAVAVRHSGGHVQGARIALGGVGPQPVVIVLSGDLAGAARDDAATRAGDAAAAAIEPASDVHGSSEYRRSLTRELVKRAVLRAVRGKEA